MIRPLGNRLYVRLDESLPNQAALHLPADVSKWRESTDQIGNRGTVVAVGPGRVSKTGQRIPMSVNVGDVVRFSELEYPRQQENGTDYVLISEMDITFIEDKNG